LDLGPSQNEPLISRRSRCNPGDAFGVRTRLFAIAAPSSGRRGGVDLTACRERDRGGKGWRPASADATRFIGHSNQGRLRAARIPRKDPRGHLRDSRKRVQEEARSTGIASSCGVPGEVQAACEKSGRDRALRVRWTHRARSLPVMSRQISTAEGSEPGLVRWEADRLDRLCEDARWSADQRAPRRRSDWMAIQPRRRQPRGHTPPIHMGVQTGRPDLSARRTRARSRNPNCGLRVHTSRGAIQLRSCPESAILVVASLGRSSTFFRYRSHSSFVDGRDACLVTARLPAGGDQCDPRHASASSAAADPRAAQQGHMK
jgi:hypothetical protein